MLKNAVAITEKVIGYRKGRWFVLDLDMEYVCKKIRSNVAMSHKPLHFRIRVCKHTLFFKYNKYNSLNWVGVKFWNGSYFNLK